MTKDEMVQLGANIEFTGFDAMHGDELITVKKIVGNHIRRLEELSNHFDGLKLRVKPLHKTEAEAKKFEIHATLMDGGKTYPASVIEHNLFAGVDSVLKKIVNELGHSA